MKEIITETDLEFINKNKFTQTEVEEAIKDAGLYDMSLIDALIMNRK